MAHIQSAVSDLFEAFRSGEGVDLVRESVRIVLQELIESEASAVIGADRYERTPERVTERNGVRWRELIGLTPFRRSTRYESRPVARGRGQGVWSDHDEQQEASHSGAGRP